MALLSTFCLMILVLTFVYAPLKKLFEFGTFYSTLELSFKLPVQLSQPAAALIITSELALGISLLMMPEQIWLQLTTLTITALFCALPLYALVAKKEIRCGCFGEESLLGWHELVRNTLLFICSYVIYLYPKKNQFDLSLVIITFLSYSAFLIIINSKQITYFIKAQ